MVDLYYLPVQSRMHVQKSSDLCLDEQSALTESLIWWHASDHAEYGKHNEKISLSFKRCDSSPYPRPECRAILHDRSVQRFAQISSEEPRWLMQR